MNSLLTTLERRSRRKAMVQRLRARVVALEATVAALIHKLEDGRYPVDSMRRWVAENYPDDTRGGDYEVPRRLAAALDRWISEPVLPGHSPAPKSQVRLNAELDPAYAPYCLRCPGLVRMTRAGALYWVCQCGATHDERDPGVPGEPT